MRLENCVLTGDIFVTAPLTRSEPEDDWARARNSGAIPQSLYDLYCKSNFLSFGAAPSFLKDDENLLFSYFSMLLRSMLESLEDADQQVRSFVEVQKLTYDAGKKFRGETWDPTADARSRRHFRDFLIAIQSTLDTLADCTALFFTGRIPGLRLGRGQFVRIAEWLKGPFPSFGLVLTPYDQPFRRFYDVLGPIVHPSGPECDWLPLMRLLRNKAAHLGQPVFRQVGLHDETPKFYTFIPRQWPYIWERHMTRHGQSVPRDPAFLPKFFRETLIHQDVITYAQGLRRKVYEVADVGIGALSNTWEVVRDFEQNQAALAELQGSSESYRFEYFQDA